MRLVDGDYLLAEWNRMKAGRAEFDQVIMCAPTIDAIIFEPSSVRPIEDSRVVECPTCGWKVEVFDPSYFNNCPECGSKIQGE